MERNDYENYAEKLKALGHPVRLKIAVELSDNTYTVNALCSVLQIPQATVSQHLSILRNKGIIEGIRSGTSISYRLSSQPVREMLEKLRENSGNILPAKESTLSQTVRV